MGVALAAKHNLTEVAVSPEGDRRRYARVNDCGLSANINGRLVEVLDISLSGVRVEAGFPDKGENVKFTLIPRTDRQLFVNQSMAVSGRIVRTITSPEAVAIRFDRVSYSLAKLIIGVVAARTGVEPFLFK